eukprot:1158271-Pelagomonas_calceolata.AAC.8
MIIAHLNVQEQHIHCRFWREYGNENLKHVMKSCTKAGEQAKGEGCPMMEPAFNLEESSQKIGAPSNTSRFVALAKSSYFNCKPSHAHVP